MIRWRKGMHIELPLTLTKLKKKSNVEKLVNYINKQSIYSQKNPKNCKVMDRCKASLIVMEMQIRICKL